MTHDLLSARMLSDEVVVLNHGEVVRAGAGAGRHPRSRDEYTKLPLDAIPHPFDEIQA